MREYNLFLWKFDDLAQLGKEPNEYHLYKSGAILREFFLDSSPLLHIVNREIKAPLIFKVGALDEWKASQRPTYYALEDAIDPNTAPPVTHVVEREFGSFIKHPVSISEGEVFSVSDIIKYAAHVGGVHHVAKNKQLTMQGIADKMYIKGLPAFLNSLGAIARVVIKGTSQLQNDVRKKLND